MRRVQHDQYQRTFVAAAILACLLAGCQVLRPDPINAGPAAEHSYHVAPKLASLDQQPIEIGRPNRVLDMIGTVVGIPSKILLWNRRVDNHKISSRTIQASADYMAVNGLGHVKVRANQYAPRQDWQRLKANKTMHWLARYTLGVVTLGGEAIFPGRIFGGDHFNPYTQTVHLYSDLPSIAWHELAHAKDFSRRRNQASYSIAYTAIPLWHETIASQDVMSYVADRGDREEIAETIEVLYPAYATYVGSAAATFGGGLAIPIYYGAVLVSHFNARALSRRIRQGQDLGPITSVASSSLLGDYADAEGSFGTLNATLSPQTSFRDVAMPDRAAPLSANFLSMNFDPRVRVRLSNGQEQELGNQAGIGMMATISLDSYWDEPVSISYAGNASTSSASCSIDHYWAYYDEQHFEYARDFHELVLEHRSDANDSSRGLHPRSDQLRIGLRFLYLADRLDERLIGRSAYVTPGGSSDSSFAAKYSTKNQMVAPSLQFQRRFDLGRWNARAGIGACAGLVATDRYGTDHLTYSLSPRFLLGSTETSTVGFATGQQLELALGFNAASRLSLECGFRADRWTGLATIADAIGETTAIDGVGGFAGLQANF